MPVEHPLPAKMCLCCRVSGGVWAGRAPSWELLTCTNMIFLLRPITPFLSSHKLTNGFFFGCILPKIDVRKRLVGRGQSNYRSSQIIPWPRKCLGLPTTCPITLPRHSYTVAFNNSRQMLLMEASFRTSGEFSGWRVIWARSFAADSCGWWKF